MASADGQHNLKNADHVHKTNPSEEEDYVGESTRKSGKRNKDPVGRNIAEDFWKDDVDSLQDDLKRLQNQIREMENELSVETDINKQLRKRLQQSEKERIISAQQSNEETCCLNSELAKMRSSVERTETQRHKHEYQLALWQKSAGEQARAANEKERAMQGANDSAQTQCRELSERLESAESHLQEQGLLMRDLEKAFEQTTAEKDHIIETLQCEQDHSRQEKEKLDDIIQTQESVLEELNIKLQTQTMEHSALTDTNHHHQEALDTATQRERLSRQEIDNHGQRIRSLDEQLESERANHIENKFNVQVMQLKLNDCEQTVECYKISNENLSQRNEEQQIQLKGVEQDIVNERTKATSLQQQLEQNEKEKRDRCSKLDGVIVTKNKLIDDLSQQIEEHVCNFVALKQKLDKTKRRQVYLEDTYGGSMRELELLLHNFTVTTPTTATPGGSGQQKSANKKGSKQQTLAQSAASPTDADEPPLSPSAVLVTLRQTLSTYQRRVDQAEEELAKMKLCYESVTIECDRYKESVWQSNTSTEESQKRLASASKELAKLRTQHTDTESQLTKLSADHTKTKQLLDKEKRKCQDLQEQSAKTNKKHKNEEESKRKFLNALYQRLLTGRVVVDMNDPSFQKFTWRELVQVVEEQLMKMVTELRNLQEVSHHLQLTCQHKDETIGELQATHVLAVDKLTALAHEREGSWQSQRCELEKHCKHLVAQAEAREKKSKSISDQALEKIRSVDSVKNGLGEQVDHLKNLVTRNQGEHASLLNCVALLFGVLWPLCHRMNDLISQRALLDDLYHSAETFKQQTKSLITTLKVEISEGDQIPSKDTSSSVTLYTRCKQHPLLRFRVAVIAVMAADRLNHFSKQQQRNLFTVSQPELGEVTAVMCAGGIKYTKVPFSGVGLEQIDQQTGQVNKRKAPTPAAALVRWLTDENLLNKSVSCVSDLHSLLESLSTEGSQKKDVGSVLKISRKCLSSLLSKTKPYFQHISHLSDEFTSTRDRTTLSKQLQQGLGYILVRLSPGQKISALNYEQTLSMLRDELLEFTQKHHSAQVEVRATRHEMNRLKNENDILTDVQNFTKAAEEELFTLRRQTDNCVDKGKFDSLCKELNNALTREKQAQDLLNEQTGEIQRLTERLQSGIENTADKDGALSDAVKAVSEAKMELRRKEQTLRQMNRHLSQLEIDKRLIQDGLSDAENSLKISSREKETLATYLKTAEMTFEQYRSELQQSSGNVPKHINLPHLVPVTMAGTTGSKDRNIGPELIACQSLMNKFSEAYKQALSKMTMLESQTSSQTKHITALKQELTAACKREFDPSTTTHPSANGQGQRFKPMTLEDFVPLLSEPEFPDNEHRQEEPSSDSKSSSSARNSRASSARNSRASSATGRRV